MKIQGKYIVAALVLGVGLFLLTPRHTALSFDEESYKPWVGLRMANETGGFPILSACPLYIAYLETFQKLGYPLSFKTEHFVTRFFLHAAIFLMLLRFVPWPVALFMSLAWISYFARMNPGAALMGAAFLCLYLRGPDWRCNRGYFPVTLIAAALMHPVLAPFLIGHFAGEIIKRKNEKKSLIKSREEIFPLNPVLFLTRLFLLGLIGLSLFFPFKRVDNNRSFTKGLYFAVKGNDAWGANFFLNGAWKEVVRTVPPSQRMEHDWYFDTPRIYKGANNIVEAVRRAPEVVGKNLLENLAGFWVVPSVLWTGYLPHIPALLALILFPLGIIGMRRYLMGHDSLPEGTAILLGSLMMIITWMLGRLGDRYYIISLPVALFCLCCLGWGIGPFLKNKFKFTGKIQEKAMLGGGIAMLPWLLLINPLFFYTVFPRGMEHFASVCWINGTFTLFLSAGAFFIMYAFMPYEALDVRVGRGLTVTAVCLSAGIVLLTAWYPYGYTGQIKAVIKQEGLFDAPVKHSYVQLMKGLNKNTKMLSDDPDWFKAFTPVGLDHVYGILELPPFEDKTGKTRELLNSLDVVVITSSLDQPIADMGAQGYLRYRLYLGPFLRDVIGHGWSKAEVPGYGTIYRRDLVTGNA